MCLRFSNRPVLRCKSRSWFRQLDGRVSPGCLYGSDPIHPLVMNRAADDYRRDLKFVAGIFRTAVLDRYAPLTAGRGDFTVRSAGIGPSASSPRTRVGGAGWGLAGVSPAHSPNAAAP